MPAEQGRPLRAEKVIAQPAQSAWWAITRDETDIEHLRIAQPGPARDAALAGLDDVRAQVLANPIAHLPVGVDRGGLSPIHDEVAERHPALRDWHASFGTGDWPHPDNPHRETTVTQPDDQPLPVPDDQDDLSHLDTELGITNTEKWADADVELPQPPQDPDWRPGDE